MNEMRLKIEEERRLITSPVILDSLTVMKYYSAHIATHYEYGSSFYELIGDDGEQFGTVPITMRGDELRAECRKYEKEIPQKEDNLNSRRVLATFNVKGYPNSWFKANGYASPQNPDSLSLDLGIIDNKSKKHESIACLSQAIWTDKELLNDWIRRLLLLFTSMLGKFTPVQFPFKLRHTPRTMEEMGMGPLLGKIIRR